MIFSFYDPDINLTHVLAYVSDKSKSNQKKIFHLDNSVHTSKEVLVT